MKRRIIRKNKKRIDPRYFLNELKQIGDQDESPQAAEPLPSPLASEEETEEDDPSTEEDISDLLGDAREGALTVLKTVRAILENNHPVAWRALKDEIELTKDLEEEPF